MSNMKRSYSELELPATRGGRSAARPAPRYRGRFSLPKTAGLGRKKAKTRQRSPRRLSDYLEELDDFNSIYRCLDTVQRSKDTSQATLRLDDSLNEPSTSKEALTPIEKLRREVEVLGQLQSQTQTLSIEKPCEAFLIVDNEKHKLGDVVWLHLQAFFANKSMSKHRIQKSLATQDMQTLKAREERSSVLEKIRNFRIEESVSENIDWLHAIYDPHYTQFMQSTFDEVEQLIEEFEKLCELFPTFHAMRSQPGYDGVVEARINLLYMWHNNFKDLLQKIQQIGEYFGLVEDGRSTPASDSSLSPPVLVSRAEIWPRVGEKYSSGRKLSGVGTGFPKADASSPLVTSGNEKQAVDAFAEMYRGVVSKSLRLHGMLEILARFRSICKNTLEKSCLSLLTPRLYAQIVGGSNTTSTISYLKRKYEEKDFTNASVYGAHFRAMNLPSYYFYFIFLARVPVDLVHQWLKMRSEKVVASDLLTLGTLIEDSRDCLQAAIDVKNEYINTVNLTTQRADAQLDYLESFDENLATVFENYLAYVRLWAQTASAPAHSDWDWCERIVKKLQCEWESAKEYGSSVHRGKAIAANRFCNVGKDLLDLLVKRYMTEKFDSVELDILDVKDSSDDDKVSSIFILCRAFKEMIRTLRERALKSLHFIRLMCSDLEICAKYRLLDNDADSLVDHLLNSGHVVLTFSNHEDWIVLCSKDVVNNSEYIDRLLNATCASTDAIMARRRASGLLGDAYLVLVPMSFLCRRVVDDFSSRTTLKLSLAAKTTLDHHVTPTDIYLVGEDRQCIDNIRRVFETSVRHLLTTGELELVDDFCSCHDELSSELVEIKRNAFEISEEIWSYANELGTYILNGKRIDQLAVPERDSLKATLLQAYNVAFEYQKSLSAIVPLSLREEFSCSIVKCLESWSQFVFSIHHSGSKSTPRWVMFPINYLLSLPDSQFIDHLPEGEKNKFITAVYTCVAYVRSTSLDAEQQDDQEYKESPAATRNFAADFGHLNLDDYRPSRRVPIQQRLAEQCEALDEERDEQLLRHGKIGKVVETKRAFTFDSFFFPSKRAPFDWQLLENKHLGTGSFGSVHLVLNKKDNCLMAMKQINTKRGNANTSSLKALADEVEIFRQLDHPNLVRYYGAEVHKEELLIFMEYCSEGTLARVCREGLDPACVRRYTHYLLRAVEYIHSKSIVHRDIKPANIFLTTTSLKLGDFGCSFRLEGTRTQCGEVVNYAGTVNYMAPEQTTSGGVVTGNRDGSADSGGYESDYAGYGRAVDIWATGCCVLEMLTGKKPYHYLEHEFQVIYQLGSGMPPRILPEVQKNELAYDLLQKCLQVDPEKRPTATELLQHTFANINIEDYESQLDSRPGSLPA
ncbi:STE/STE11/MEKK4 protein kinase [Aphelenchoides avenae]|nr:STE/STE11/MEKK4 protein kinase [Aphelenchus avenae]